MNAAAPASAAAGVTGADVTTFRLGGPLPRFRDCARVPGLRAALREADAGGGPWRVIGGGSNLLVSDAGWDGTIVRFLAPEPDLARDGDDLVASGACELDALARYAVEAGLDGLLFATGIPGTVGGAVAGNAGAFGRQVSDVLLRADVYHPRRGARTLDPGAMAFGYRRSALPAAGEVVESVRLRLAPGDRARLREERERILDWRRARHPDWRALPTAGSFFRNLEPTSAAGRRQAAGWFLEQAGAPAMRVGGAGVFERHANIIVKRAPDCTAADVHALAGRMARAVRERFGLALRAEVRRIGAFAPDPGGAPEDPDGAA